jgi:hypothetical protein
MRLGFSIDIPGHSIYEVREVSRRFVRYLHEVEFRVLLKDQRPRLFLWAERDILTELPAAWIDSLLPGQIVPDPEDVELSTCPTGCCYVAMLWKGDGGTPIVVMRQFH